MRKTYIIGVKKDLEPTLIVVNPHNDIAQLLSYYYRAYIFETKKQAHDTWQDWYQTYREKNILLNNN